jgi:signal transduction histidine kinase
VQAGVAVHVLHTRPDAAADALQAIKAASKEGLRELRAILNVLRQADEADPTQPAPGVAQLETLVDGARRAGLETTLTVTGHRCALPAAVDLAAYRIVQESLTNAIRHAGPATASVTLGYGDDELRIDVADTGRGKPVGAITGSTGSEGSGHGLAGMRERAAAVGGSVKTGPSPGGGYRVAARLPLHGRLTGDAAPAANGPAAAVRASGPGGPGSGAPSSGSGGRGSAPGGRGSAPGGPGPGSGGSGPGPGGAANGAVVAGADEGTRP